MGVGLGVGVTDTLGGSLAFTLRSGTDSLYGDVTMVGSTGQPLQEALAFHTPLVAAALPRPRPPRRPRRRGPRDEEPPSDADFADCPALPAGRRRTGRGTRARSRPEK